MTNSGNIGTPRISRRMFLAAASAAAVGCGVSGCVTHPVTGKSMFVLMSEQQEISEDRTNAPHQFSSDYGVSLDNDLNQYVDSVGRQMGAASHRPQMPYSFRAVNSPFINAYTFAGGSVAITRGLLLGMENEAGLAAVLGHELGHVNMRHRAQSMTQQLVATLIVAGVSIYVKEKHEDYAALAAGLGEIGAGALLAHYSRQDEREADDLGMAYAVKVGHNPVGMVQTMDLLRQLSDKKPSLVERMFSSHPMSEERYQTTLARAQSEYAGALDRDVNRERFMDHTAGLRRFEQAIYAQQAGTVCMMKKAYAEAEQHYARSIRQAPNDYAGLLMMANCQRMCGRAPQAEQFARKAMDVYPREPQAHFFLGIVSRDKGNFGDALGQFQAYRQLLDGNPMVDFNCGLCCERMGRRQQASQEYTRFLNQVNQGEEAEYAYNILVKWGVIKKPEQTEGSAS